MEDSSEVPTMVACLVLLEGLMERCYLLTPARGVAELRG